MLLRSKGDDIALGDRTSSSSALSPGGTASWLQLANFEPLQAGLTASTAPSITRRWNASFT